MPRSPRLAQAQPGRADGRTIAKLRDRLARRDGYRCRTPTRASAHLHARRFPLEVHHLDGDVTNDPLDNLVLRRRHNLAER